MRFIRPDFRRTTAAQQLQVGNFLSRHANSPVNVPSAEFRATTGLGGGVQMPTGFVRPLPRDIGQSVWFNRRVVTEGRTTDEQHR